MSKSPKPAKSATEVVRDITVPAIAMPVTVAAKSIGISKSKMYELIADGQIKVRKIDRRTIIECSELAAFVARCPRSVAA